jgi:hypothetical protein
MPAHLPTFSISYLRPISSLRLGVSARALMAFLTRISLDTRLMHMYDNKATQ